MSAYSSDATCILNTDIISHELRDRLGAMQSAMSDLVDARLPRSMRVTQSEGQAQQRARLLVSPAAKHDPPTTSRPRSVGLHATGKARSIPSLGLAAKQLGGFKTSGLESRALL